MSITSDLKDRVAIVTGGASGIGEACSQLLAKQGARVAVVDLNIEQGKRVVANIEAQGREAMFLAADVSDTSDVVAMARKTRETYGGIDILVNAAGVLYYGTIVETPDAEWQRVIAVNLTGTFLCCREVVPHMVQRGKGSIINFSSTTGAHGACARAVAYVASKGGVAALTRAMCIDHARQGIRVNALCPGPTDTAMLRKAQTPEQLVAFADSFPMGRLGKPMELAHAVLFLASDESSFMTGAMLTVDGGQTAEV